MTAIPSPFPSRKTRLGFHYYSDTLHYRESDLNFWLPELQSLGASWLVLQSAADRAIPETFLTGLLHAGIEPIIQFRLPLANPPDITNLTPLLQAYARWGARAVLFFDRPNARAAWSPAGWAQQDLVERFLDHFIPLAVRAHETGLTPVFPTLEPGGNFWDTAFLRAALQSLSRRKQTTLLQHIVLSAYGWTGGHSLTWGAGGPEAWSESRAYITPAGSEDQRGFHIFDWYTTVAETVLDKTPPILVLGAGIPSDPQLLTPENLSTDRHSDTITSIARMARGESLVDPDDHNKTLNPLPENVLAVNYWLLADDPDSPYFTQAWYQGETQIPAVQALKDLQSQPFAAARELHYRSTAMYKAAHHPIKHYLLLPLYEWGVADWHLEVIRPFIKHHTPTIGFSINEAAMAEKVTVIGSAQSFSEESLEQLRFSGCIVERITGDGTTIASKLSER